MTKEEFKEIRLKLGLSQRELAIELGFSPNRSNISRLEKGRAKITKNVAKTMELLISLKNIQNTP